MSKLNDGNHQTSIIKTYQGVKSQLSKRKAGVVNNVGRVSLKPVNSQHRYGDPY
jgi:hypothetical protein